MQSPSKRARTDHILSDHSEGSTQSGVQKVELKASEGDDIEAGSSSSGVQEETTSVADTEKFGEPVQEDLELDQVEEPAPEPGGHSNSGSVISLIFGAFV